MYFVRVLYNVISSSSNSRISPASFVLFSCSRDKYILLCRHEQSKISARCFYVQLAGVNGVAGATAETTTYDRIVSTMKAMEAIMAGKGMTDPSKVTAIMLANAYKKVWNEVVQPFLASLIFCTRCLG